MMTRVAVVQVPILLYSLRSSWTACSTFLLDLCPSVVKFAKHFKCRSLSVALIPFICQPIVLVFGDNGDDVRSVDCM